MLRLKQDNTINKQVTKRLDYISWAEYFMGIAVLSAQRSKDPNTQVGSCIVDASNKVVSVGYNGFPLGCLDDKLPWGREGDFLDTKYPYVVHAEQNAIMNSYCRNLDGCVLYVTLFPCHECCKLIIQSGICRIVYLKDNQAPEYSDSIKASKKMFDLAGITFRVFDLKINSIVAKLLTL